MCIIISYNTVLYPPIRCFSPIRNPSPTASSYTPITSTRPQVQYMIPPAYTCVFGRRVPRTRTFTHESIVASLYITSNNALMDPSRQQKFSSRRQPSVYPPRTICSTVSEVCMLPQGGATVVVPASRHHLVGKLNSSRVGTSGRRDPKRYAILRTNKNQLHHASHPQLHC